MRHLRPFSKHSRTANGLRLMSQAHKKILPSSCSRSSLYRCYRLCLLVFERPSKDSSQNSSVFFNRCSSLGTAPTLELNRHRFPRRIFTIHSVRSGNFPVHYLTNFKLGQFFSTKPWNSCNSANIICTSTSLIAQSSRSRYKFPSILEIHTPVETTIAVSAPSFSS